MLNKTIKFPSLRRYGDTHSKWSELVGYVWIGSDRIGHLRTLLFYNPGNPSAAKARYRPGQFLLKICSNCGSNSATWMCCSLCSLGIGLSSLAEARVTTNSQWFCNRRLHKHCMVRDVLFHYIIELLIRSELFIFSCCFTFFGPEWFSGARVPPGETQCRASDFGWPRTGQLPQLSSALTWSTLVHTEVRSEKPLLYRCETEHTNTHLTTYKSYKHTLSQEQSRTQGH